MDGLRRARVEEGRALERAQLPRVVAVPGTPGRQREVARADRSRRRRRVHGSTREAGQCSEGIQQGGGPGRVNGRGARGRDGRGPLTPAYLSATPSDARGDPLVSKSAKSAQSCTRSRRDEKKRKKKRN